MRPFLAILITVCLLGGTLAYTRFAASVRRTATEYRPTLAADHYSIVVRRTFAAAASPVSGLESLTLHFRGQSILSRTDDIAANERIEIDNLQGVEVGPNELYIAARPDRKMDQPTFAALEVSVLRDDRVIEKTMFSNSSGLPLIAGSILFAAPGREVDQSSAGQEEGH